MFVLLPANLVGMAVEKFHPRALPLVFLTLIVIAANLRVALTAVGPLVSNIQADLGLSASAVSLLTSIPLLAFAAVSPVAPRLIQKLGLEKTLLLGVCLLALGVVARSLDISGFLWGGTLAIGVAIAVLNVSLPVLVKRDFPARISSVTGIYSAVQGGFAAIAAGIALPVAGLAESGWRLALGLWALVALVAVALLLPQTRRRAAHSAVQIQTDIHPVNPWRSPLGWQIAAFMGVQSLFFYTFLAWLSPIEQSLGVSAKTAGTHQSLYNLGGVIGSLLFTALLPKLPSLRPLAVAVPLLWTLCMLGFLFTPQFAVVLALLAGISCGILFVLSLSLFGLRTRNHVNAGALSGMGQSVGYVIAAAGPVLMGAINDVTGSWAVALWILAALGLAEIVLALLVSRNRFID